MSQILRKDNILFSGTPTEYLEHYVFPVLLPALEEMLRQAKKEKCLEVKCSLNCRYIIMLFVVMMNIHCLNKIHSELKIHNFYDKPKINLI